MRKFNRLHCFAQDSWGRVITLTGTHAYTIHIEGISYRNICEWKISKKKI